MEAFHKLRKERGLELQKRSGSWRLSIQLRKKKKDLGELGMQGEDQEMLAVAERTREHTRSLAEANEVIFWEALDFWAS